MRRNSPPMFLRWVAQNPIRLWLLAVGLAGALSAILDQFRPRTLQTDTDIIGSTVFYNFNVNEYFFRYGLYLIFILASIGIYSALVRWLKPESPQSIPNSSQASQPPAKLDFLVCTFLRLFLTGFLLSLASRLTPTFISDNFYFRIGILSFSYVVLISLVALWIRNGLKKDFFELLSLLNLCFMPFCVFSLYAASATTLVIHQDGTTQHYPWLPLWLALVVFSSFVVLVVKSLQNNHEGVIGVEKRLFFLIAVPVLIFLREAYLPGDSTEVLLFHEGERLASGWLLLEGYFPWRDVLFTHGLLEDPFKALVGFQVFGKTYWGAKAGNTVLVLPIYWTVSYFAYALVLRGKGLWILFACFLLPEFTLHFFWRFLFYPPVIISFYFALKKASFWRTLLFSFLLFLQVILTPESTYLVLSFPVVLAGYEWYSRKKTALNQFPRTWVFIGSFFLFLLGWFSFLHSQGAFWPFVHYYQNFASGHRFTGGIPVNLNHHDKLMVVFFSLSTFFIWSWIVYSKIRSRSVTALDWTLTGIVLFGVFYFQKYLCRADGHIYHSFVAVAPAFVFIFARGVQKLDIRIQTFKLLTPFCNNITRRPVAVFLFILMLALFSPKFENVLKRLPGAFQQKMTKKSDSMGYTQLNPRLENNLESVDFLLSTYLKPSDTFFDFTNRPALFHFLLKKAPSTRYFHISMAMHKKTQEQLIQELEESKPPLVSFATDDLSDLSLWDEIPNQVRHHRVSQYLLQNYVPFVKLDDYLFLRRKGRLLSAPNRLTRKLGKTLKTSDLYAEGESCVWGYVPYVRRRSFDEAQKKQQKLQAANIGELKVVEIDMATKFQGVSSLDVYFNSVGSDEFFIADSLLTLMQPKDRIQFKSLEGQQVRYTIQVGSCLQWYGYKGKKLFLAYKNPETKVRALEPRLPSDR